MSAESTFLSIAEYLGKKAIDAAAVALGMLGKDDQLAKSLDKVQSAIAAHVTKVENWSATVQTFRMPEARWTDGSTIPLTFSAIPRKFQDIGSKVIHTYDEEHFFVTRKNYIILGQPGSGKTTTVKRIARALLFTEPKSPRDDIQMPILVRLNVFNRARDTTKPLMGQIATELGLDHALSSQSKESSEPVQRQCEGRPIEIALPPILDSLRATILLDGLDEVGASLRTTVESDIRDLALSSRNCRFIVTCRSADYTIPIEAFDVVEVRNLTPDEIGSISRAWLGDKYPSFRERLGSGPLLELASRPLFLVQIVTLFANSGYLPAQPFEVYRSILLLMIKEWDRERNLVRPSKYAGFEAERKIDFLSQLAYELLFMRGGRVFSDSDLKAVYAKIYRSYELPASQERKVVNEIESHTGIIAESGGETFEFTHLTLQEYLCAYYLVRRPFPRRSVAKYLKFYPAPVAIATALSSDPLGWLIGSLSDPKLLDDVPVNSFLVFLDRLKIEHPSLAKSPIIGFALIQLLFSISRTRGGESEALYDKIESIIHPLVARNSLIDALTCYTIEQTSEATRAGNFALKLDPEAAPHILAEIEDPPIDGMVNMKRLRRWFDRDLIFSGPPIARRRPSAA